MACLHWLSKIIFFLLFRVKLAYMVKDPIHIFMLLNEKSAETIIRIYPCSKQKFWTQKYQKMGPDKFNGRILFQSHNESRANIIQYTVPNTHNTTSILYQSPYGFLLTVEKKFLNAQTKLYMYVSNFACSATFAMQQGEKNSSNHKFAKTLKTIYILKHTFAA